MKVSYKYANGLGPARWGKWNKLLPFSSRFFYSGLTHDFGYAIGGTEQDKERVDIQFFQDCLDASGKNIFAIAFSCFYFIMVYKYGHKYFNYNQKQIW